MKRILPKSLFGQMALILLSGLLLAQLFSTLLQFQERGQRLFQASGMQSAERIAEIVRLLDGEDSSERQKLVSIVNVPPLKVSLSTPVWLDRQTIAINSPRDKFHKRLLQKLGDRYRIHVAVSEHLTVSRSMEIADHMQHMKKMSFAGPDALVFLAQVQLTDGSWVTFENRISDELFASSSGLFINIAVVISIVLLVTLFAVKLATRPLSMLAEQADRLGKDINQTAMPETGSYEMRHASHALNTMQTRLQQFIADRSRLLSAISHDLKTPITRMRLRSEMLENTEQRESFIRNLDEMQGITAETLDFLRADDSSEKLKPIDLCALLESVKDDALEMGQAVDLKHCKLEPFPARFLALKRCITNLVDNAIKYAGNAVISATEIDGEISISICDSGPGIPQDKIDSVFLPFYRLESSRNRDTGGTGLGLSIARNIILSHGGELTLTNQSQGGLKAKIVLNR